MKYNQEFAAVFVDFMVALALTSGVMRLIVYKMSLVLRKVKRKQWPGTGAFRTQIMPSNLNGK